MSSQPGDDYPELDDETLSDVVRRPTRTAGDLSEVADGLAGITPEDVAHDLGSVAPRSRTPTDRELLGQLLRRVERIERHLRISSPDHDVE